MWWGGYGNGSVNGGCNGGGNGGGNGVNGVRYYMNINVDVAINYNCLLH